MPYTLTRDQRDALHAEAITDLSEIGDIYLALEHDDYRLARELWRRYEPLLLLLDQLGWEPKSDDDATVVEIAMPDAQLASAARRLTRVALGRLRHLAEQQQPLGSGPDVESALHCIAVIETCSSLLADIALLHAAADRLES